MDRLNSDSLANYQPYWVVRARLLERLGRPKEAIAHLDRAISMAHDVSVRNFLLRQMADLAWTFACAGLDSTTDEVCRRSYSPWM